MMKGFDNLWDKFFRSKRFEKDFLQRIQKIISNKISFMQPRGSVIDDYELNKHKKLQNVAIFI